jgi:hypothetical protein
MKRNIFQQCLKLAIDHNTPELHPEWGCYHHFSFIIQENKIVEWATNTRANSLTYFGYSPHCKIHSETQAYKRAKGILKKNRSFDIINIRLNKFNKIKMSKPCGCCTNFLKGLGVKRIWFTTEFGFAKLIMG